MPRQVASTVEAASEDTLDVAPAHAVANLNQPTESLYEAPVERKLFKIPEEEG
jgi:hypothetical protein